MPSLAFLRPFNRRILQTTASLLSWLPVIFFVQETQYRIMAVQGPSMYPFLNPDFHSSTQKNSVLVDMRRPWEGLRRGSVVALWSPSSPQKLVVKRVIALEGDQVTTRHPPYPFAHETVPYGHVWVEGDNADRQKSYDSNDYGPVPKGLIVGQLRAVVWPWKVAGWISWQDYGGAGDRVVVGKEKVRRVEVHGG